MQARQLDRQLERQQIVDVELESGQILDAPEPLAQRVRMDIERARRLDYAASF
jgi:hypothetical protein